jgi:hypothetical protein
MGQVADACRERVLSSAMGIGNLAYGGRARENQDEVAAGRL